MKFKTLILLSLLVFQVLSSQEYSQDTLVNTVEITPEILFKKNVFSNYTISPDGKYFVTTLKNNAGYEIVVIEIDSHKVYKKIPIGKYAAEKIYFINSHRMLIEIVGKIIAIDADGTNSTMILDVLKDGKKYYYSTYLRHFRTNSVVNTLPQDDERILVESSNYKGYAILKKVNIYTGNEVIEADGIKLKMNKWLVDTKGKVKLGVRRKKNIFTYHKKSDKTGKWEPLTIKINSLSYTLKTDAATYLNQPITFEGFSEEEDIIYLATNLDSDKRKIISYNIKKEEVAQTILEDPIYDITDPMLDNSYLMYDSNGLIGVSYDGAFPVTRWFSEEMQEYQISLDKKYPSYINQIIGFDRDKKKLLVKRWNDTYRGLIGVYMTESNTFNTMISLNKELKEFQLSKIKTVTILTKDGEKLQGYFNTPKHTEINKKHPLVVIPHGGPWSRDVWEYDPIVHYFNQKGFATLKVNFRGSVGFGKNHLLKGINNINTIMIDDIAESVEFIKNKHQNTIDTNNIFIYGHSYGGYAAYMSTIRYPKLYRAAVAVSALSNLKEQLKDHKKNEEYFAYEFWKTAIGTDNSKKLKEISPVYNIDKINTPIFIFHGEDDKIISSEQAKEMNKALQAANKEVSLRIINNEGHSLYNSNNIIFILNKTVNFFNQKKVKSNN